MANDDIRLGLKIIPDSAGSRKAIGDLDKLNREIEDLKDSFRDGKTDVDRFSKELADLETQAQKLDRALSSLEEPREIDIRTDNFDRVSRDVSLAGDAESNLRTVGGALGAFGLGGAERGIGAVAEIPALIEALPRLQAAAAGLPQTINAAGAALGTSGVGLIGALGVAGIAIAGLNFVLGELSKRAEEAKQLELARNEAIAEFNQFVTQGGTTDEAITNIEALRLKEQELLATRQEVAADQELVTAEINRLGLLGERGITTERNYVAAREANNETLEETDQALAEVRAQQQEYTQGLEDGTLAANDAAEAERRLAEERITATLETARQAGELEATRQQFADSTREQIQAERDNIAARQASLEAELASLQASGQTSEEVQDRIAKLTEEIAFLGVKSEELAGIQARATTDEAVAREQALASARTASARATDDAFQAELERAQEGTRQLAERKKKEAEAEKEAEKAREEARKKRLDRAARSRDRSSSRTPGKASTSETQGLQDEFRRLQNDRIRAENDAEQRRVEQVINNNRRLQDIARDFGDSRADALEEGNFLALERINTEEARAKRDQRIDNQRANEDIRRDNQNALREIQNQEQQLANQRIQANAAVIQGTQQLLRIAQQFRGAVASFDSASRSGRSFSQAQEQRLGLRSTNASRPITS